MENAQIFWAITLPLIINLRADPFGYLPVGGHTRNR
jgi:hypothetical protein